MHARRPQALEAGLFLLCVALPLAILPPASLPFADAKPLFLTLGALLVWLSGLPVDRRLVAPAAALAAVVIAASVVGVDPLESVYGTARPTGLVMLLPALSLVVVAPSIPDELLARARRWLLSSTLIAASVALVEHVAPALLDVVMEDERFIGGTFGNPVIFAGFLALGLVTAFGPEPTQRWRDVVVFAVLGAGFGVVGERSAFLLPVVAIAVVAWLVRPPRGRLLVGAVVVVGSVVVWTLIPETGGGSTRSVASQFATTLGERQRVAVATANLRAVAERPILGWGPANAWGAFLSSATPEEIRTATRAWGDAHNVVLQFGVTTGLLGVLGLVWLGIRLVPGVLHPTRARAWAAAGAVTLLAFSLYEPLDPVLTPLLFLLAGASSGGRVGTPAGGRASAPRTAAWVGVTVLLAGTLVVSVLSVASSILEEWGETHFGSRWALEDAQALAPWRLSATEALAIDLALDARSGDDAAGAEARELVADSVERHPWNPGIRLLAADVEVLLQDEDAARAWITRQLERFPSDTVRVPSDRVEGGTNELAPQG